MAYPGVANARRPPGQQQWRSPPNQTVAPAKRPPASQVGGLPAKALKTDPSEPSIIVFSTAEKDELGIRTLVGEYREEGTNHGRRFYRKSQKIPGHEDINVYLYFWDERDGPAFSGWWFGNQVGGAQVWSRNRQSTQMPPKTGWTIPWDGDVKRELVVMGFKEKQMLDRKEAEARQAQRKKEEDAKSSIADASLSWEERIIQASEKVATVSMDANEVLETAKLSLEGHVEEVDVVNIIEQLEQQNTALAEVQRFMAGENLAFSKASPTERAEITSLGQRVKKIQQQVKEELSRVKSAERSEVKLQEDDGKRFERESKERELENQHAKQLEEMMPAAIEKVDSAEDEVEKVAIAAAPLQVDTADDLRPVMLQAIKETEQRVRAAQSAIGEARRFITGKISQAQRFAPGAKKAAAEEFSALQAKLNASQEKLNPFKTIRQDYEMRTQVKKLMEELSGKLAGAEIEVEKAAMMTAPIGGDSIEGIKETETALSTAQSALAQTSRLIDSKLRSAEKQKGPLYDEVQSLQERAKIAQDKLDEVRKTVRETQVRIAADTLLKEVSEKVSNAEDELQKMAEAELPFLRGDTPSGKEVDELLAEADKVASKVHTAIAEAQTFVARKLVEVARFSEGPATAVREEVDMLQKRLEEGRDRLQQFRSSTGDRKRTHLLQEVESKVAAAETEVQKMMEATQSLGSLGSAGDVVSEQLKEAVEQAMVAERIAQGSIVVARKNLLQKTAELKKLAIAGAGSGSELGKLQTRVNSMQQEVAKLRSATKDAEEKIRVKQMLAEVSMRLQAAEGEVEKVSAVAAPLSQDHPSPEAIERLEKATASGQMKVSTTAKLVDVKLKNAQGFLKEELEGMRDRLKIAERKLFEIINAAKHQKEKLSASDLVAQANEKVDRAEAEVKRTGDAELPFLKGVEVLNARDAAVAIADCEAAASCAQKAITDARSFVVQKLGDAKQFSDGTSEICTKDLLIHQQRLDACAAKLTVLKKDTAERKRKTQMQTSQDKLQVVENAVQNLSNAMMKFAEDNLQKLNTDEARAMCEAIAVAEQDAQAAVADARKYLALRVQEAKTFADSQREFVTGALAKLQSKLTHFQVELAKLSKQCTEREQKYVAYQLLQEAQATFGSLETKIHFANECAVPIFAEDNSEFVSGLYAEDFVSAIREYAQIANKSPEELFAEIVPPPAKKCEVQHLAAYIEKLPEKLRKDDLGFSGEQAAVIFAKVAHKNEFTVQVLQRLMSGAYICTLNVAGTDNPEKGREVCTIAAGEGIQVEEVKEVDAGHEIGKCTPCKGGDSVWVTLNASGASNFKKSFGVGRLDSIEAHIVYIQRTCKQTTQYFDRKSVEVAGVKSGPLADVKGKLGQLKNKVSQEQAKIDILRKKVADAKLHILSQRRDALQKVLEQRVKKIATKSVESATQTVESAEKIAEKLISDVTAAGTVDKSNLAKVDSFRKQAEEVLQNLGRARGQVSEISNDLESRKGCRTALLEARVELTKLTQRIQSSEKRVRTATHAMQVSYSQLVVEVTDRARSALRSIAAEKKITSDELFELIAKGKGEASEKQFVAFFTSLKAVDLQEPQLKMVFREIAPQGLRKPNFALLMQQFYRSSKVITITDAFDIENANPVRKLGQGEIVEALEGPQIDMETKVKRVRARAVRDGSTGWVTLEGNQGAVFLKPVEKPLVWCCSVGMLRERHGESSKQIRGLKKDEVFELLEGPREENLASELLLKCCTTNDKTEGWITLRDATGFAAAELCKGLYVCRSTIAMTDVFDIKNNCQVIRKIDVGETLEVVGEEKQDSSVEIFRLQFKAMRDGKQGWVTLKGNQGTVFVEPSSEHYTLTCNASLRSTRGTDSAVVKEMQVGEHIVAMEPAQEAKPEARIVTQVRSFADGACGWVSWNSSSKKSPFRPWNNKYVCRHSVEITSAINAAEGGALRRAEVGEVFKCCEGPRLDEVSGLIRIRLSTEKEGILGWASVRSADDCLMLEPSS